LKSDDDISCFLIVINLIGLGVGVGYRYLVKQCTAWK
jgi:hypothetical protein